jgi:hypothetical protein
MKRRRNGKIIMRKIGEKKKTKEE